MNTSWFVLNKYYLGDKMRRVRWMGLVARTGVEKSCMQGFSREFEVYIPRLRPRCILRIILKWILKE
jgi:hypothetical protein